jgi:phage shock protein PspC (stress-responsive transcriptional regulator)
VGLTVIAMIRPDGWKLPLFLHILGAMVLVGGLVLAATYLFGAWRQGDAAVLRSGFRALLIGVIPGWLVMRIAAEWILSKEHLENAKLSWVDIGFSVAEPGLLLIIIATVLAGMAARRGSSGTGVRVAAVLVGVLVVAYLVAIWAMTTKPT